MGVERGMRIGKVLDRLPKPFLQPALASGNFGMRIAAAHLRNIGMGKRVAPDCVPSFLQRSDLFPVHHEPVLGAGA